MIVSSTAQVLRLLDRPPDHRVLGIASAPPAPPPSALFPSWDPLRTVRKETLLVRADVDAESPRQPQRRTGFTYFLGMCKMSQNGVKKSKRFGPSHGSQPGARLAGTPPTRGRKKEFSPPRRSGLSPTDRERSKPRVGRVRAAQFDAALPRPQCALLPTLIMRVSCIFGPIHSPKLATTPIPDEK